MESLKNKVNDISDNTEHLINDYLKLFSIKQTEKIALLLGVLSSVFIISILLFMVLIFCSIALANELNALFEYQYWGYWIVAGIYLLITLFLVIRAVKTKTPLLTNLFVKLIGFVFSLDSERTHNLKDLQREKETINHKIDADKANIKNDYQTIRYGFLEMVLKEVVGVFRTKKKKSSVDNDVDVDETVEQKETDPKAD